VRGMLLVSSFFVSSFNGSVSHFWNSSSEARVSGCEGNLRQDDGVCQACGQCKVGEYITGQCSRNQDGSFTNTCEACPVCDVGKYLSKPCSGKQLGAPDHVSFETSFLNFS
jgi:hypothetical protein